MRIAYLSTCMALCLAGCADTSSTPESLPAAEVRVERQIPLAPYMSLAVVMPEDLASRPDMVSRLQGLGIFAQVLRSERLPAFVADHGLTEKVGDLRRWSSYQALARAYAPFLVFRFDCVAASDGAVRYKVVVTRADDLDNVFVADIGVLSRGKSELMGLLTLGAGLRQSNCWGASDHGQAGVLFESLARWLHKQRRRPPPDQSSHQG